MTPVGDFATRGRMLVVTGKGGVGKSVVAAALGDALARAGRRVLLVEVDPRESLYRLLDTHPSGGEVVPVSLGSDAGAGPRQDGRLALQNLQPKRVIERMVAEHLRLELLSKRVIASSIFQHFIEAAPGLKEMAVLVHAMRTLDPGPGSAGDTAAGRGSPSELDTVILDAPATGHGVALLAAPRVVAEVIEQGPFGRVAREMTAFMDDPRRLGIVVVAGPEKVPVQEAIELFAMLGERVRRGPDLLVVNGLYPAVPAGVALGPPSSPLRILDERRRASQHGLDRLRHSCGAPTVELPLLPLDPGPHLVAALGRRLAASLDVAADAA